MTPHIHQEPMKRCWHHSCRAFAVVDGKWCREHEPDNVPDFGDGVSIL